MGGMRAIGAVIGVAAALGLCVWGGTLTYDAIDSLIDGARLGETRTPIPGTTDVELDEGKYVVFYEVDAGSVGEGNVPVPSFTAMIQRSGDGPALSVKDYGSDFRVESGGRVGQAVSTVRIPSDGRYRIRAGGSPNEAADPAVVLGKPVTRRVLRLILGIAAFLGGLGLGILVITIVAGLAFRDRRKQP